MIKIYFLLAYEFMKIGVFAIGGGYAALPFLYYIQEQYNWFSLDELTNMIAVSNITPGPIGINMATYTGFTTAGIVGSVIATVSIVFVPFLFCISIMKIINKYKTCSYINDVFLGLRPASCALLTSIALKLLYTTLSDSNSAFYFPLKFDILSIVLFIILLIPFSFMRKNPLLVIVFGAVCGIILKTLY